MRWTYGVSPVFGSISVHSVNVPKGTTTTPRPLTLKRQPFETAGSSFSADTIQVSPDFSNTRHWRKPFSIEAPRDTSARRAIGGAILWWASGPETYDNRTASESG